MTPAALADRIERRTGVTRRGQAVVAVAFVAYAAGQAIGSRSLVLLVYGGLLFFGCSWALGRRRLAIDGRRSDLPGRVRVGQQVEVELALVARRRVSTIVLAEYLPEPLGAPVRVPVPLLPAGKEVQAAYRFSPRRRGVFDVGPLVAEWSDPFGLTRHRFMLAPAESVIVHPNTEAVTDRVVSREWEDPPMRPPVSKPWPSGFEFYGLRDYQSGDDPRRIVWRATARTLDPDSGEGRYLVRESEQGITDQVRVFLDTHRPSHSPGEPSETFEVAVRTAASLGVSHLQEGSAVSLDANSARLATALRGQRSRIVLLDALAAVHREEPTLGAALDRLAVERRRNAHNVIVTPHLDRETATRLRLLLDAGTSLLLVMVVWEESDFASLHRAGALGCNVIEVSAHAALERLFRRVVGSTRR